ncbi:MAG: hypothetical protein KA347_11325, partial [Bacteroidia bacterium]|nr:hypothetical protein [Bacteroidia bacterium]
MHKFILLILISYYSTFPSYAQLQIKPIENVSNFEVDPLGNCYYLRNDEVIKVNALGKELVRYSMKN